MWGSSNVIARSLFPASGQGEKTTRVRNLRDEKMLSNPNLVENFLSLIFTNLFLDFLVIS